MNESQYPAGPQAPQGYPQPAGYGAGAPQAVPQTPPGYTVSPEVPYVPARYGMGTPQPAPQTPPGYTAPPEAPYVPAGYGVGTPQPVPQAAPGYAASPEAPYVPAGYGMGTPQPVPQAAPGYGSSQGTYYVPAGVQGAAVPVVSYGTVPSYAAVSAPPFAIGGRRAPRDPRQKGASRTFNRMCLLVIGQTAATFFWEFLFIFLMTVSGTDIYTDSMAYLWLSTALVPLSTALPFFLYLVFTKSDPSGYLRFEKVGLFGGTLCVLAGLAICLLANYPSFFVQEFLGNFGYESAAGMSLVQEESWRTILLELASTAVLVPVMEEFAFRGVLLSALRKYGMGFSIMASATVFALVHLDIANVVFAFVAGLVFGYLYARTNNLWLTICIHALNNGIAVLTSHTEFLFGSGAVLADNALMLAPILVGILALVFLLVFKRGMFTPFLPRWDGPQRPLSGGESALSMARAPVFWVIVGMMLLTTASLFW